MYCIVFLNLYSAAHGCSAPSAKTPSVEICFKKGEECWKRSRQQGYAKIERKDILESRWRAQWWQMYVSVHTQVTHIVSKYLCMYICMYHCFKMKRYDFYNVFCKGPVPLHPTLVIYWGYWNLTLNTDYFKIIICDIAYPLWDLTKQDPPKPGLWGVNIAVPSQNSGEDSLSLSPLIYACITSCQLAGCLTLGFPCQRRLF